MKHLTLAVAILIAGLVTAVGQTSEVVTVYSICCPWLAGMTNGTVGGDGYDSAPVESPVHVPGLPVAFGMVYNFSATGSVNYNKSGTENFAGPAGQLFNPVALVGGAENGMAELTAPIDALVGVFLDDNLPSQYSNSIPAGLIFTNAAQWDFASLAPLLRQPFFIGTGSNSSGAVQQFVLPAGATRLFLGTMDSYQWTGNQGSFTVKVTAIPNPGLTVLQNTSGVLNFSWSSLSNQTYQLQYSTNLAVSNWVDLGAAYFATNTLATATDAPAPDRQRFYRVQLLP